MRQAARAVRQGSAAGQGSRAGGDRQSGAGKALLTRKVGVCDRCELLHDGLRMLVCAQKKKQLGELVVAFERAGVVKSRWSMPHDALDQMTGFFSLLMIE